jgi:hypothetical protein
MIQRPKTTPSGLSEADHKRLVEELTKYAKEGASDEDLRKFRETFISVKKKESSEPTSQRKPLASPTKTTQPSTSSATGQQTRAAASVALGGQADTFQKQVAQADPFKGEYKNVITGAIEKPVVSPQRSQNRIVADQAYEYAVKNVSKEKSIERLKDEEDQYQIMDGITDGLKSVYNKIVAAPLNTLNEIAGGDKNYFKPYNTYKPLELEKKAAIKELKEERGLDSTIPEEDILKRAKDIFVRNDQQEQMHQLIDKSLPRGYDREGIWKELKLKELNSNALLKSKIASAEVFKSQLEDFKEVATAIREGKATKEQIDSFDQIKSKALVALDGLKYLEDNFDNFLKEATTDQEKLELFKYNYNDFEKTGQLLWSTTKNIFAGTTKLLADTSIYVNRSIGNWNNPIAQELSQMSSEVLKESETETVPYYRYKASNIDNWSDLGSFSTQLLAEQIPVLASIYLGGTAGTAAVSMGSGGQKIYELEEQAKQPFGRVYSDGQKLAAGWLYSGAEFIPERIGTARILKDLERTVSSASTASRKMFMDSFFKNTFKGLGKVAYATGLEGGTEYITAESQIKIDKELLDIVKTDTENNELRAESFFSGALMGGKMALMGGALGFGVAQSKLYSERKDIKNVRNILSEIDKLNSEIENNKTLTETEKKSIYEDINALNNKAFSIVERNAERGKDLSIKEKSFLLDVNKRQGEIREEAENIRNSNFSKQIKRDKLEVLKNEFNSLEEKRNSTLQGRYNELTELSNDQIDQLKREASSQLTSEGVSINDAEVEKRAIEILNSRQLVPAIEAQTTEEINKPAESTQPGITQAEVVEVAPERVSSGVYEYEGTTYTVTDNGITSVDENGNEIMHPIEKIDEVVSKGEKVSESVTPQTIIDTNVTEYLGNPTITEVEDGQLYEFRTEDGIMAGVMTSPTEFRIDGISANEVGKGKGSRMFEELIAYLKDKGVTTINTQSAGEGAVRMHNKAVEKGLLTKVEEDGRNATFTIITEQVAEPQDVSLDQATEEIAASEIETTLDDVIAPASSDIREQIARAKKALSKILPNVEIVYHTTAESFRSVVGDNSRGFYNMNKDSRGKNIIHINGSEATENTVAHEVFHAILLNHVLDGKPATRLTNRMLKALAKSLSGRQDVVDRINKFVEKGYAEEKEIWAEEKLAELLGYLASEYETLPDASKNIIQRWLEKIAVALGIKKFTDQQVVDFMNAIATKVAYGQEITEGDVSNILGYGRVTNSNVGNRKQAVSLMKGTENLVKYGLKQGKNITRKVGEALEKRQRQKYGYIEQNDRSESAKNKISNWMVDEVKYFIEIMGDKSGKGWYGEKYQKALDNMSKIFPEMKTDQNARDLFTILVAITSDGQKVLSNFKLASFAYDYYKKNGTMPSTLPGQRTASFEANLKRINKLLSDYKGDIASIKKDLMEVKSIEELNKERKKEGLDPLNTSWPVSFKAPFAASVFGPKLGMFYSNLSGNEAYPTLDRWWSRTFNRYRGTLIPSIKGGFNKKGEALGLDRFKQLLGTPNMSNEEAILASKTYRDSYAKKGYKNGTEVEKAANTIYKAAYENLNDAPFNKTDRQFMYDSVSKALSKLNKEGYDLSIADVQAILWYFEKNLYKTLGVQANIEGISYEEAANTTFEKWKSNNNSFDYNIKESEDEAGVEGADEDIKEEDNEIKGRRQISPENSSNYANMTEDGKGNFVFYHFGPKGIKSISPKKYGSNKGAITSKPEVAAMGRVGGMSQYYTRPEYSERNVVGDKYMIKVPMDRVYDFNTDPDNLFERAKELFKRRHPDLPFTPNDQLAYITKLAEKAGYDITVAEWNNTTRAQSTKELSPVDVQEMDGNTISKPFKEEYESNATRGFVSVIPVSKEAKLKEVYDKINEERNSQNKYDSLYSLREDFPKLSQDEITTMIEESNISQEMKDAYAEALAYEPGVRMSGRRQVDTKAIAENTKGEVDRMKALPIKAEDGATFNLDGTRYEGGGLVVPMNSLEGNTTQEELSPEMIGEFAKENEDSIGDESMVKLGIYKFPAKTDVSVDMNIVIPNEHRDIALEFGALIGQESLFDLDTYENVKTGADGLNPMKLTAEQFRDAAASLKNGQMPQFLSGRRQRNPIDVAVESAKSRGFDDKAIIQYLTGRGYTIQQATNAVLRYNSAVATKARKDDSVFTRDGRNKIVTFLDQIKRRAFSARSFLPRSVFNLRENIESNIKAEAKRASYLVDEFNSLIKKYKGDVNALHDEFDKYLRGDQTAVLPKEFRVVAGKMRMHIDNLSEMLLRNGAVTASQAETIAANLGQYINRSYQVFDKKNWAKQVTEEMKEAARVDLRNMYRATAELKAKETGMDVDVLLEDFVNKKVEELISGESAETFLGIGKTGSKDMSIMKQRTDIPLSIRQLMGEYTDASQNYARTVLKIATFAENARFLQSARDAGMGVFFFNENDPNRPKEFNTKIAGDSSQTMNPLNGLYTTPEIAKAFMQKVSTGDAIEAALGTELGSVVKSIYTRYMQVLSSVKWLKTIASVATHAKNVTGNIWFMLSNGYVSPKRYAESFKVLKNSTNEQLRDKLDEYIRAGIIDQSAALGEIRAMFADADFDTAIESRLKKGTMEKVKSGGRAVVRRLSTAYQLEDDFYKIISYETEKSRRSEAYFDKPFDQLTQDQQDIVKSEAAEITKNVLPNYSRIPGLVKLLKAVPVTGTFVSFQAEAFRTAWNTVALAFDEIKSDNKKVRAIGAKRLSGIAMAQAAKYGLMAMIGTVISGGDDDEDELKKNVKKFVAPWSKDSDVVLVDYGKGKMSYIDFSSSDPHGGIKKAYNSMMSGEDFMDSLANGVGQLLEPFVKEDMLLQVITDIKNNTNPYGGTLYNESDTNVNKINAVMARVYKAFEPGTITSIRKIADSDDVRNELTGQLTGYKINTVDVGKQLGFKMKDLKEQESEARRLYRSALYRFEDNKITDDELLSTYDQANKSQKDVYSEMIEYMKAASFFGVDDADIHDTMKNSGVAKGVIDSLWYGETPDLTVE